MIYKISEGVFVSRNGRSGLLETPYGNVRFMLEQMPDQCGMALLYKVRFREVKDALKLEKCFNDFLCATYSSDGWDENGAPFANTLNVSMLVLTDSDEYAEYDGTPSLWSMCTRSSRWSRGASNINANTDNVVAVFTHVRDGDSYNSNG